MPKAPESESGAFNTKRPQRRRFPDLSASVHRRTREIATLPHQPMVRQELFESEGELEISGWAKP